MVGGKEVLRNKVDHLPVVLLFYKYLTVLTKTKNKTRLNIVEN